MKVFISWSGERSHKVATVFRDWLPSVIQSIAPYVSSEDIDKGARWSTDIAKELEDSTFGILCVTRENLNAPWLTFEAGALSKTMDKSLVSPFLFDIKRSEVDGPILQFQSTVLERDDIFKLLKSLNKACDGEVLTEERLRKAFDVWYPTLEEELGNIPKTPIAEKDKTDSRGAESGSDVLEEILEISRLNQKLLRSSEASTNEKLAELAKEIATDIKRYERSAMMRSRKYRRWHPGFIEELIHMSPKINNGLAGFQIAVSMFRDDFPWIYDAGIDLVRSIRSADAMEEKDELISAFMELVDLSFEHPMMRERLMPDKEMYMIGRELPHILRRVLHLYMENSSTRR